MHVNGQPRRSCVTPVESVDGAEVTTIEGVQGKVADAVRAAWQNIDVPQCGYCQSGQIMSAVSLLQMVPDPGDEDIDRGMAGNICRCATYMRIRRLEPVPGSQERFGELFHAWLDAGAHCPN